MSAASLRFNPVTSDNCWIIAPMIEVDIELTKVAAIPCITGTANLSCNHARWFLVLLAN